MLPSSPRQQVVVNLSQVDWPDSTLLAALVYLKKRTEAARGELILYGVPPLLREMLEITRLEELFLIVANESEALRRLKANTGDTEPASRSCAGSQREAAAGGKMGCAN
jgi:anti-anti-sigma regulatory factor